MKYKAVFFDLDGTLLDTSPGVIHAIDYIIEKFNLVQLSNKDKRCFIGPPIQRSFQMYYDLSEKQAWNLAEKWREAYKDIFLLEAKPYEGIYELLLNLRKNGTKTGVATNKREDYTMKLLEHFDLLHQFDCVIGSDIKGERSKLDMIRLCKEKTGIYDSSQCLMVGDTIGDMEAAQKVGVDFLGVTYGFGLSIDNHISNLICVDNCADIASFVM